MSKWKPTNASERIMVKIATHDPSLRAVCSMCRMSKKADGIADTINDWGQKAVEWGKQTADWASKDNFNNLKNVGVGLGTGLGTYALSGLLPGAKKHRGLRLLGALGAGLGAGAYGDEIRQGVQNLWDKTPWRQKEFHDKQMRIQQARINYNRAKNEIAKEDDAKKRKAWVDAGNDPNTYGMTDEERREYQLNTGASGVIANLPFIGQFTPVGRQKAEFEQKRIQAEEQRKQREAQAAEQAKRKEKLDAVERGIQEYAQAAGITVEQARQELSGGRK